MKFIVMQDSCTEKAVGVNLSQISQIRTLIYKDRCQLVFLDKSSLTVMHNFDEIMDMIKEIQ